MKLIDADNVVNKLQDLLYQKEDYIVEDDILWYDGFNKAINRAIRLINESQQIIKHGHWIPIGGYLWKCSECHCATQNCGDYCSDCGAKMDEEG